MCLGVKTCSTESVRIESTKQKEVVVPVKKDYESLTVACYRYIQSQIDATLVQETYEYADGVAMESKNLLYAVDSTYFGDSLIMRFVDSTGEVYGVFANETGVVMLNAFESLHYETSILTYGFKETEFLIQNMNFFTALFTGSLNDLDASETDYILDAPFYGSLNMDLSYESITGVVQLLGKSELDLDWYDKCLLQFTADGELFTFLITLNRDYCVTGMDIL